MDKIHYPTLEKLVNDCQDHTLEEEPLLEFGEPSSSPHKDSISAAEKHLNIKFPESFLWFLKNYGEGEILDNFLFTVCDWDPSEKSLNDIVYRTMKERSDNLINNNEVLIFSTNFEDFIWRTDEADEDGEYPVYLQLGDHREYYAPNYIAFLIKYIKSCLEDE